MLVWSIPIAMFVVLLFQIFCLVRSFRAEDRRARERWGDFVFPCAAINGILFIVYFALKGR